VEQILYVSKQGLSLEQALINKGVFWGELPFTSTRIINGKIIAWPYHERRLERTLEYFYGTTHSHSLVAEISEAVLNIAEKCKEVESVYLRVTLMQLLDGEVIFFILANEKNQQTSPLKIKKKHCKEFGGHPYFVKNGSYSWRFKIQREEKLNGFDDLLLHDHDNHILELTTSNIFFEKEGTIYTPELRDGILDGTIRSALIHFLIDSDINIIEKEIKEDELATFTGAFSTNSFSLIREIQTIDEYQFTNDKITDLKEKFYTYMVENDE
jgi:branched-subunit amino acid aminotransferase/4-amino-4-deoxychorismate lyase